MRTLKLLKMGMVGLVGVFASLLLPSISQATVQYQVAPGYDLLETTSAYLNFQGAGGGLGLEQFIGQPIGSADFLVPPPPCGVTTPGSINTGNADTIICRKETATGPADDTIGIEVVALSLRSVNPIAGNLGGTPGDYLLTTIKSSDNSTMKISWDSTGLAGTFTSNLNLLVDLWDCQLNAQGVCVKQGTEPLTNGNPINPIPKNFIQPPPPPPLLPPASWSSTPPTALLIPGVNYLLPLPGVTPPGQLGDGENDFFLIGVAHHDAGNGTIHDVKTAPEPASLLLLGSGLGLLAFRRRKAA